MQVETTEKKWFIDSGCSCHMTGHKGILSSFQEIKGGDISFGDKTTGGIIGQGSVDLNSKINVSTVNLVKTLDLTC